MEMLTALVVWSLVALTTTFGIVWAQHTHPERYTKEALDRRFAFMDEEDDDDDTR